MDPKQQEQNTTSSQPVPTNNPSKEASPAQQPVSEPKTPTPPTQETKESSSKATTPPSNSIERRVSLRTIVLIVALALLTAILLFVALRPMQKSPQNQKLPAATPTPSKAHSSLSLELNAANATPTAGIATKSVNVMIDTTTNKVEGVQFDLSYDPTVLTNVVVAPGAFFPNPLTLLNQVDTKNGKIHYALGIQPTGIPQQGKGVVAVISFTMIPTKTATTTKMMFLPKTQVVEQGTLGSVLEKSTDLTIPISSLSTTTQGAIQPTATK